MSRDMWLLHTKWLNGPWYSSLWSAQEVSLTAFPQLMHTSVNKIHLKHGYEDLGLKKLV